MPRHCATCNARVFGVGDEAVCINGHSGVRLEGSTTVDARTLEKRQCPAGHPMRLKRNSDTRWFCPACTREFSQRRQTSATMPPLRPARPVDVGEQFLAEGMAKRTRIGI